MNKRTEDDARFRPVRGDTRTRTIWPNDRPGLLERQAFGNVGRSAPKTTIDTWDDESNLSSWSRVGLFAPGPDESFEWTPVNNPKQ